MRLINGPGSNPVSEQLLLRRGQGFMGLRWRHGVVWVCRGDGLNQFAFFRFAWNEGVGFESYFTNVQPQFGFAVIFVRTVAFETVVRKQRADVAIEADFIGGFGS